MSVITAQTASLRELDHPANSGIDAASFGNPESRTPSGLRQRCPIR